MERLLLHQNLWDTASTRLPGREVEFVVGLAFMHDVNGRVFGGNCVAILIDIANYYPDRLVEVNGAVSAALGSFPDYLQQELSGKLADNYGAFLEGFRTQEAKLTPYGKLRGQRYEQIYKVLSDLAALPLQSRVNPAWYIEQRQNLL